MLLKLIVEPAVEPVLIGELKDVARPATSDDDNQLGRLIRAARSDRESFLNRALITQTWELTLPDFCGSIIELPKPPLQSVTSIKYYDGSNVQQTLAASYYNVVTAGEPGYIELVYGQSWPSVYSRSDAVAIRFVCGYGTSGASVPQEFVEAIKILATHLYDHPEEVVIGNIVTKNYTADMLCWPKRFLRF